jgi:hypothetical protein
MDAMWIITVFALADDLMKQLGHRSHRLAHVPDAEVVTVAIVAAKYFQNHHERTFCLMQQQGYLSGTLSVSRFNRRLHALDHWLGFIVEVLAEVFVQGDVFIIDSLPVPTCRRVRASRCRKVRGRDYCGYCAAKQERFFGWRLHVVCTPQGIPVRYTFLPGAWHDLTPVYELTVDLAVNATVFGDKGYVSEPTAAFILDDNLVRLVALPRKNMKPLTWADEYDLRQVRHAIETLNSQLESMGVQRLHARTIRGMELKIHAALIALAVTNLH